jgi:KUP system potassium uptake protein
MVSGTATAGAARKPVPGFGVLLSVLGVVYGDIGTSPLYALKASLQLFQGITITTVEILGILSLIFWSLILIVTIKYVTLIMRADNHGEGGILALMALAQRVSVGTGMRSFLGLVGIAGACLFFALSPRPSRSCRRSKAWKCRHPDYKISCCRSA